MHIEDIPDNMAINTEYDFIFKPNILKNKIINYIFILLNNNYTWQLFILMYNNLQMRIFNYIINKLDLRICKPSQAKPSQAKP